MSTLHRRERRKRAITATLASSILVRVFSITFFLYVARVSGPLDIGVWAFYSGIAATVTALADATLSNSIASSSEAEAASAVRRALPVVVISGVVIGAVLYSVRSPISRLLNTPVPLSIVLSSCVTVVAGLLSAPAMAWMRRTWAFHQLAVAQTSAIIAGIALGVVALALGASPIGGIATQAAAAAVITATFTVPFLRTAYHPEKQAFSRALKSRLLTNTATSTVDIVGRRADDIVVGVALGPAALGVYSVAYRIFLATIGLFGESLVHIFIRDFADLADDLDRMRREFRRVAIRAVAYSGLPMTLVAMTASAIVPSLKTSIWSQLPMCVAWLMLAGTVQISALMNRSLLMAVGATGQVLVLQTASASLGLVMFLVVAPQGILPLSFGIFVLSSLGAVVFELIASSRLGERPGRWIAHQLLVPLIGTTVLLLETTALQYSSTLARAALVLVVAFAAAGTLRTADRYLNRSMEAVLIPRTARVEG